MTFKQVLAYINLALLGILYLLCIGFSIYAIAIGLYLHAVALGAIACVFTYIIGEFMKIYDREGRLI